jgi:hypothetical protein
LNDKKEKNRKKLWENVMGKKRRKINQIRMKRKKHYLASVSLWLANQEQSFSFSHLKTTPSNAFFWELTPFHAKVVQIPSKFGMEVVLLQLLIILLL